MKPFCEVAVDRQALLGAIEIDGAPLNPMQPDEVRIGPAPGGIRVETVAVSADLPGVGVWTKSAIVDRFMLHRILSDAVLASVLLTFVGGKLSVNRKLIDAFADAEGDGPSPRDQLALKFGEFGPLGVRRGRQVGIVGLPLFRRES